MFTVPAELTNPSQNLAYIEASTVARTAGKHIFTWRQGDDSFTVFTRRCEFQYRVGCTPTEAGAVAKMASFTGNHHLGYYVPARAMRESHRGYLRDARHTQVAGKHSLLAARALSLAAHTRRNLARRLAELRDLAAA